MLRELSARPVKLALALSWRGAMPTRESDPGLEYGAETVWVLGDLVLARPRRLGTLCLRESEKEVSAWSESAITEPSALEGRVEVRILDAGGALTSSWSGRIERGRAIADELPLVCMLHVDEDGRPSWARKENPDAARDPSSEAPSPARRELDLRLSFPVGPARVEVRRGSRGDRFDLAVPPPASGEADLAITLSLPHPDR